MAKIADLERKFAELLAANSAREEERTALQAKIAEAQKKYEELSTAKEIEASNYKEGITKLFKFKDQVKELLDKNKK